MRCIYQIILAGLVLILLSSCSMSQYIKRNNRSTERWACRLCERNGSAFYLSTTYSYISYVWTDKREEIEVRRLVKGKVQKKWTIKGNWIINYDGKALEKANNELEERCPFELDGDLVGYFIRVNGSVYEYSHGISMDCMEQNVYDSEILNGILYVLLNSNYNLWKKNMGELP